MQETQILSLGWEDPLEEGMATHSSILAWRIPWTEESDKLPSIRSQRVRQDWSDLAHTAKQMLIPSCLDVFVLHLLLETLSSATHSWSPHPTPPPHTYYWSFTFWTISFSRSYFSAILTLDWSFSNREHLSRASCLIMIITVLSPSVMSNSLRLYVL